jgi:hypothetical protein
VVRDLIIDVEGALGGIRSCRRRKMLVNPRARDGGIKVSLVVGQGLGLEWLEDHSGVQRNEQVPFPWSILGLSLFTRCEYGLTVKGAGRANEINSTIKEAEFLHVSGRHSFSGSWLETSDDLPRSQQFAAPSQPSYPGPYYKHCLQ